MALGLVGTADAEAAPDAELAPAQTWHVPTLARGACLMPGLIKASGAWASVSVDHSCESISINTGGMHIRKTQINGTWRHTFTSALGTAVCPSHVRDQAPGSVKVRTHTGVETGRAMDGVRVYSCSV